MSRKHQNFARRELLIPVKTGTSISEPQKIHFWQIHFCQLFPFHKHTFPECVATRQYLRATQE